MKFRSLRSHHKQETPQDSFDLEYGVLSKVTNLEGQTKPYIDEQKLRPEMD